MLRPYQQEAVDKCMKALNDGVPSVLVAPTAFGKSHCIAGICEQLDNALILAPSKELVLQDYEKLEQAYDNLGLDKSKLGIYSAGLNRREIKPFTFATVNSIYRHLDDLNFSTVLIDEGDLFNPDAGMYKQVIDAIGTDRVLGLTATPYRFQTKNKFDWQTGVLQTTTILRMLTDLGFFKQLIQTMDVKSLTKSGYLAPIEYYKDALGQRYTEVLRLNKNATEYTEESLDQYGDLSARHTAELARRAISKGFAKKILVFAVNVKIAEKIAKLAGVDFITGETKAKDRDRILREFKDCDEGILVNVATLTTGVDIPSCDCIILARPTQSPRLYSQIVGRGIRIDPDNPDKVCKLIDCTKTVSKIGKVEDLAIRDGQLFSGSTQLTNIKGKTLHIKAKKHVKIV